MSSPRQYDVLLATLAAACAQADAASRPAEGEHLPAPWERNLRATCECLSWRGALNHLDRRDAEDELGATSYGDFPVHARSLLVTAHKLIDAGAISERELKARMSAVRERLRRR